MNFIKQNQNLISVFLVISLTLFVLLVLSPFIPISPIQYVTKAEKAMIYSNTAINDLQRNNLVAAENNFKKAILLDSQNIIYQENLGTVLFVQPEKKNEALDIFNKILRKNPNSLTALYYLGSFASDKSDYEEAKKKFQAYLNINPDNAEVLTLLGVSYYKAGNKEGAKEQWQKALKVKPDFEAAKNNLFILEQEKTQMSANKENN